MSPADPEGPQPENPTTNVADRHRARRRSALEWLAVLLGALVLAIVLRTVVVQAYSVPSSSMFPTLQTGDRILVDKAFYNAGRAHTGDIIVFSRPRTDHVCGLDEADFVKRVIATAGELVYSRGNAVYVNNKKLVEPYLPKGLALGMAVTRQRVPKGDLFVMGDNRPESCDSRYWGYVPTNTVVGKVALIWWRHNHPDLHFF